MSIGGHWPDYPYRRYYWYGCHPYRWYGYYPPGYVIDGDSYNHYYYDDEPRLERIAEVQRKFEKSPPAEPAQENQTDRYFDQGVKAFEAGDYFAAADNFHDAQKLAPKDIVLPFARIQALFAANRYQEAASALREALVRTSTEKDGVFYPRGLYPEEQVLTQQIDQLSRAVQINPADSDLHLLLGYQLLGTNKLSEAAGHLQIARQNSKNKHAATTLSNLLQKLKNSDDSSLQIESTPKVEDGNVKASVAEKQWDTDFTGFARAADNWLAVGL